jgi:hypothetical protein
VRLHNTSQRGILTSGTPKKMSQQPRVTARQRSEEHYNQMCAAHGTQPTSLEVRKITEAVGPIPNSNRLSVIACFRYDLLYFLPRSAVVFKDNTLLVGWIHHRDGTKQEIWFRSGIKSLLFSECGAPPGSVYSPRPKRRLCDEWHPPLKQLFKVLAPGQSNYRRIQYAYLAAVIRFIQAGPDLPCIENARQFAPKSRAPIQRDMAAKNKAIVSSPERTLIQEHDIEDAATNEDLTTDQYETAMNPGRTVADSTQRRRNQSEESFEIDEIEEPSQLGHNEDQYRDHESVRQPLAIDLTLSDSEEEIKLDPNTSFAPLSHDEDDLPAEQELRDLLQSKRVDEIKDILAQRGGQVPRWIEAIMRQEMEKKMARDLAMIKNFF